MPHLRNNYFLNFYGGEPLLAFPLIKKTISFLKNKNNELKKAASFSLTTNGSLLTEDICLFLDKNKFSVVLSFDGLAQDIQRKKGTLHKIVPIIKRLLSYPSIHLEINSVFTSKTVSLISQSIQLILDLGVSSINCSLSIKQPWDKTSLLKLEKELTKLGKIVLSTYKKTGLIPVKNFTEDSGTGFFYCAAGKDRLAISPKGHIWGCVLFPDYFQGKENLSQYKKYHFGALTEFIKQHEKIYPRICANYAQLTMENFSTPQTSCFLCPEVESCSICPINTAFSGSPLQIIPTYICEIQKIRMKVMKRFRSDLQNLF